MDDPRIPGVEFYGFDIAILRSVKRNHEALKDVGTIGRNGELFRHLEYRTRLASLPTRCELRRSRTPFRVTFRCSVSSPFADHGNLRGGQAPFILKSMILSFCFPGRHVSLRGD